ncbi:MAG: hypothetical protein H6650_14705 [Ardenticatenales bacterium]|nr:hypothetical protein [Ardenticatenales bacterium]
MIRRILGFIMLFIGLSGLVLSIGGALVTRRMVDNVGQGLDQSLRLVSESLDTVLDTLALTKTTVGQVNGSMTTVETTATDLAQTINQTRPLLDQVSQIASSDVPDGIDAVQAALPNVAEVAGTIDTTLRVLNNFRIDQSILGFPIKYDLGINYNPVTPFDQSITAVGGSLDGIPERLRTLKIYLNVTDDNLATISQDVLNIAADLETINGSVADVQPLLDEYTRLVTEVNDNIRQTRANLTDQLAQFKIVLVIVFVWIGLTQAAPVYLGWELLRGRELSDTR